MAGRMRQKTANFWLHPPPISLDIYSALHFILCISVAPAYNPTIITKLNQGMLV